MKYTIAHNKLLDLIFLLSSIRKDIIKGITLNSKNEYIMLSVNQGSSYIDKTNLYNTFDNNIDFSKIDSVRIWGYLEHRTNEYDTTADIIERTIHDIMLRVIDDYFRHNFGFSIDVTKLESNFGKPETMFADIEWNIPAESFRKLELK